MFYKLFYKYRRVLSCGILETPRFGRKSNFLFVPGSTVAFECDDGFVLMGDVRRTCTSEGRWDPADYGYTECLRKCFYFLRKLQKFINHMYTVC